MPTTTSKTNISRAPVVAVMGHIDHGKSTLLDYIRKSNIVGGEVGGITQTISAYEVSHKNAAGKDFQITFLDTPGHEAFVGLRDRGAKIADLAILVVSAEDGVKPQTIEALKSIRNAELPYIVAINKIDKENANIERTKQSLAENDIFVESYGGGIPCVPISAKTGQGVPELLDMVLLVSELEELDADSAKPAEGLVLESERQKEKGIMATLVIKDGTLKSGQFVVAGESLAPIRILENFLGKKITEATFSSPVRIIGFDNVPAVGSVFKTFDNKKDAEKYREEVVATNKAKKENPVALDDTKAIIPILIKANNGGAIEAIEHEIEKIKNDRTILRVISKSIGDIAENDIKLASTKEKTIILAFSVKTDNAAKNLAERFGLEIKTFDIIYKLSEYLEEAAAARTPKIQVEERTGSAKIIRLFSHVKDRQVIGGRLEEGLIAANEEVKIFRRDAEIGRGHIRELQQAKTKIGKVEEGEFGAMVECKVEIAPGDKIECFSIIEK